ncbi:hypothetical protein JCM10908_002745 [Rhodotorula pacifica]|uniref:uncharacterized protein n=1 Tax=Rhodotorula pacifica TaxID=1495444 RepID=UPI0031767A40
MSLLVRKLGQTVFPEILPAVLGFTLVAVAITVGFESASYPFKVNTIMLSVLTTMLSFAVSLRTSSALERWNAGRQAWTTVSSASRSFAAIVWLHVSDSTLDAAKQAKVEAESDEAEIENVKALIEKRTILNLLCAWSVATKHYVRGESGIFWDDLYELVKALPRYSFPNSVDDEQPPAGREGLAGLWRTPRPDGSVCVPISYSSSIANGQQAMPGSTSSTATRQQSVPMSTMSSTASGASLPEKLGSSVSSDDHKLRTAELDLSPGYNPPERSVYEYAPVLRVFRPLLRSLFGEKKEPHKCTSSNIPLEIHLFLNGYLATCIKRATIPATAVGPAFTALNQLADSLATMERVLSTPLPFSYSVHLRATAFFYLLLLPFQIYQSLGWLTIPAQFIAACVFWGFLELARQIEQPFGYDDSDLDLDKYCALIAQELQAISAHAAPSPSTFAFSPYNTPFAPLDNRPAPEILVDFSHEHGGTNQPGVKGVPGMRRYLAKHYADVEERSKRFAMPDRGKGRKSAWAGLHQNRTVQVCIV